MYKYNFAICAILKDEPENDIKEWVSYHSVVGCQHFFLYDNASKISLRETLKKEIAAGLATIVDFPGKSPQMPAYQNFVYTFGKLCKFAAIIDGDEFLCPKPPYNLVPDILENYDKPNIYSYNVSWVFFGSSGVVDKPTKDKLVIETYTMAMPKDHPENKHTKPILIRPGERTLRAGSNPHYMVGKPGFISVSEDFTLMSGAFCDHKSDRLVLQHFCLKSLENFKEKISKPRADKFEFQGKKMEDFDRFNKYCTEINKDIFRFIEPTRAEMEKYK